jgi:hypothetical protein
VLVIIAPEHCCGRHVAYSAIPRGVDGAAIPRGLSGRRCPAVPRRDRDAAFAEVGPTANPRRAHSATLPVGERVRGTSDPVPSDAGISITSSSCMKSAAADPESVRGVRPSKHGRISRWPTHHSLGRSRDQTRRQQTFPRSAAYTIATNVGRHSNTRLSLPSSRSQKRIVSIWATEQPSRFACAQYPRRRESAFLCPVDVDADSKLTDHCCARIEFFVGTRRLVTNRSLQHDCRERCRPTCETLRGTIQRIIVP